MPLFLVLLACDVVPAEPADDPGVDETGSPGETGEPASPETGSDTGLPPGDGSEATYSITGFDSVTQSVVTRTFTVDLTEQIATVNYVELAQGSGVQFLLPFGSADNGDFVGLAIEGFVTSSVEGQDIPTAARKVEMVPVLISSRFAVELTEAGGEGLQTSIEADGLEVTEGTITLSDFQDASPPTLLDCLETEPVTPCETVGGTLRLEAVLDLSDGGETEVAIDIDGRVPALWQTRP
ncbi:MAG: hypothetical protein AAF602_26370 [Myxococcota bacterium]